MNDVPTTTPKKGLSGLAIAGIGCGGLFVVALIGVSMLAAKSCSKVKEFASDYQKSPVTSTAKLIVGMNPDLELVKADETTKEITIKDKKSGQTMTVSLDDLKQGKFKVSDDKGNVTTIDPTSAKGQITMKGADGSVVIGGETSLPAWLPVYPGAKASAGGMRSEKGDQVSGTAMAETTDAVAKVKEFYQGKLKDAGFDLTATLDTPESVSLSASKKDSHQSLQVTITRSDSKTLIMSIYEGPK